MAHIELPATPPTASQSPLARALVWATCIALVLLTVVGFQATRHSRRNLQLLLEQQLEGQLALLWLGLAQDMEGAQRETLMSVTEGQIGAEPPYDLTDVLASSFARFPYPESFFTWSASDAGPGVVRVFNRADRPPPWQPPLGEVGPYPVEVLRDPAALRIAIERAQLDERKGQTVTAFMIQIGDVPYQVVVRFMPTSTTSRKAGSARTWLIGFTVNLQWVREMYFEELAGQISQISKQPGEVSLEILDDAGAHVAATTAAAADAPALARSFPLIFMDRSLLRVLEPDDVQQWTARVLTAKGGRLAAAATGTRAGYVMLTLFALMAVAALIATVRQVREAATLAAMKSEFVANVTHDLKAPLAVIQLIAETLSSGRYESPRRIPDYLGLLQTESQKLTRLIDNVLSYARLGEPHLAYALAPERVSDLVGEALVSFRTLLAKHDFVVRVDIPSDLPAVNVDRVAFVHVLGNLIDNAIKYSADTRVLEVHARVERRTVRLMVDDHGIGIAADELAHVCEKFYRSRSARNGGSGLGLSIACQTVKALGGTLSIQSNLGQGTSVEVSFPAWTGSGEDSTAT